MQEEGRVFTPIGEHKDVKPRNKKLVLEFVKLFGKYKRRLSHGKNLPG